MQAYPDGPNSGENSNGESSAIVWIVAAFVTMGAILFTLIVLALAYRDTDRKLREQAAYVQRLESTIENWKPAPAEPPQLPPFVVSCPTIADIESAVGRRLQHDRDLNEARVVPKFGRDSQTTGSRNLETMCIAPGSLKLEPCKPQP